MKINELSNDLDSHSFGDSDIEQPMSMEIKKGLSSSLPKQNPQIVEQTDASARNLVGDQKSPTPQPTHVRVSLEGEEWNFKTDNLKVEKSIDQLDQSEPSINHQQQNFIQFEHSEDSKRKRKR